MGKRTTAPYWIRSRTEFDRYEFKCSVCGMIFSDTEKRCPHCDSVMKNEILDNDSKKDDVPMPDYKLD